MQFLKLLFVLIIALVGAAFAVMNAEAVNLNYYFGTMELSLSIILVAAVIVGALLGAVAGLGGVISLRHENRRLRREAKLASQEITSLRTIPIRDK
ncbi:MAG: LapA family protein [Candidatus Sedimenticola sp. (ex Thyasira tokunagai)]